MSEYPFYLMHRDTIVTVLTIDDVSGAIIKVSGKVIPELLPLGGRMGTDSLRKWWQQRAVPITQGYLARFLRLADIATTQSLMVRCLGLSLSDHYWICPIDKSLSWNQVNLFSNDYVDQIGEAQFNGQIDTEVFSQSPIRSPASSLRGDLQKRWIICSDGRYLVKGNRGPNSQQSLNEVFASLLHQKQGFPNYTPYTVYPLGTNVGGMLGCICKGFTSETIELIPAIDVVNSEKKDNAVSVYEHFIRVCANNGLLEDSVRGFLEYQILTDFVLTNTDRHLTNFGVLRDSESLKFIGMAPIFDSGNSMFWDNPKLPLYDPLTDIPVNSFYSSEDKLMRLVHNTGRIRLSALPTDEEVRELYKMDTEIQMEAIRIGYHKKIDLLEKKGA